MRWTVWLEMTRDADHGGPGWEFGKCLWAPTQKKSGTAWPFWDLLLRVQAGDPVVHLKGKSGKAAFVGYSIAATGGSKTQSRPSLSKEWSHSPTYYRVDLKDFVEFPEPIHLATVFREKDAELKAYFRDNRMQRREKEKKQLLFYVLQNGKLQCLNGAYLTQLSDPLWTILFETENLERRNSEPIPPREPAVSTPTSELLTECRRRVGQQNFSRNVRKNFGHRCCFPGCPVDDHDFLVGAHIVRWSDSKDPRGITENGLCLCLFHDRSFELGLFTLTADLEVRVRPKGQYSHPWVVSQLLPFEGQKISPAVRPPAVHLLEKHRSRVGYMGPDW